MNTFKASACVSAHIPLTTTNHMASPKVTGVGKYILPQGKERKEKTNVYLLERTSLSQSLPSCSQIFTFIPPA